MKLALLGLAAVALVGLQLALARGSGNLPHNFAAVRFAHAHLGFLGWVGALITAVSWQVVPMFYLAPEVSRWAPRLTTAGLALTTAGLLGVALGGLPLGWVAPLALPGALVAWALHPALILHSLKKRKRRRADPTLWFWWLGMAAAPACLVAGALTVLLDAPWPPLVYGVLVLWAWAAAIVHGMLTRIVPFLVWLHRCAPWVGKKVVPSTRELYPDRAVALGWWLHVATLAVALLAVTLDTPWLYRALGLGAGATALHLAARILLAVRAAPR